MKKIITAILFFCSLSVKADAVIDIPDFQLWSTTNGTDIVRVIPNGVAVSAQGCSDPDSYMVKSTLSAASISRIYATLLAAKMASKPVTIVVIGCETNRPAIVNVLIK